LSWDAKARGSKRGYFYKSIRRGDRIVKVYMGRGEEADEAARQIEQRRKDCQAQREAWQEELAQLAAADQHLRELQEAAYLLVAAVLTGAGYHQRRGEWRKQRRR